MFITSSSRAMYISICCGVIRNIFRLSSYVYHTTQKETSLQNQNEDLFLERLAEIDLFDRRNDRQRSLSKWMAFDVIRTCAIAQRFATAVNRLLFFAFVRFRVSKLSVCYWTMWTRTKPAAALWCSLCGQWSSPAAKISFLPEIELLKAIFEAFEFWNLCRDRERCSSLPEAEYPACSRLVYEQRCFRAQPASLVTICCILGLPVKTPVSYLVVKCVVSCFCAFLLFVQQQNQTRWWLGAAHTHARAQLLFATLSGFASCVLTTLNPVIF